MARPPVQPTTIPAAASAGVSGGATPERVVPINASWSFDRAGVQLISGNDEVLLPALEFRVLDYFVRHPNIVLTRDQLVDAA